VADSINNGVSAMAEKQDVLVATLERDRPIKCSDGTLIELMGEEKSVPIKITRPRLAISSRRDREQEEGA